MTQFQENSFKTLMFLNIFIEKLKLKRKLGKLTHTLKRILYTDHESVQVENQTNSNYN